MLRHRFRVRCRAKPAAAEQKANMVFGSGKQEGKNTCIRTLIREMGGGWPAALGIGVLFPFPGQLPFRSQGGFQKPVVWEHWPTRRVRAQFPVLFSRLIFQLVNPVKQKEKSLLDSHLQYKSHGGLQERSLHHSRCFHCVVVLSCWLTVSVCHRVVGSCLCLTVWCVCVCSVCSVCSACTARACAWRVRVRGVWRVCVVSVVWVWSGAGGVRVCGVVVCVRTGHITWTKWWKTRNSRQYWNCTTWRFIRNAWWILAQSRSPRNCSKIRAILSVNFSGNKRPGMPPIGVEVRLAFAMQNRVLRSPQVDEF